MGFEKRSLAADDWATVRPRAVKAPEFCTGKAPDPELAFVSGAIFLTFPSPPAARRSGATERNEGNYLVMQYTSKVIVVPFGEPLPGQKKCHPQSLRSGGVWSRSGPLNPVWIAEF